MARVLIAANTTWNIKNFRLGLIRALLCAGHEVVTVTPDDHGVHISDGVIRHRKCAMERDSLNPLGELAVIARLFSVIRAEKPDVFLGFTIKPNIYGCSICRLLHIPCIPNVSGLGTAFLAGRLLRRTAMSMYRFAFTNSKFVCFQNPDDRDLFVDRKIIRHEQAKLLPGSGIDLRYFSPTDLPVGNRFLMISRLLRDKGVREYVQAARILKRKIPSSKFMLAGQLDPANRTSIDEVELTQWIEEGSIEYLGSVADVRPLIRDSAAVVLPSYREGLPRTLLEAAAMGRPLIGSDVPGCRQLVREGATGFLCEARSASSLAAAMERFASTTHEERLRIGVRARNMAAQEFDQAIVFDAYLDSIRRALSSSRYPSGCGVGRDDK